MITSRDRQLGFGVLTPFLQPADEYQTHVAKNRCRVLEQRRLTQYQKWKPEKLPRKQRGDVAAAAAKTWSEVTRGERDYAAKRKKTFARSGITAELDGQNSPLVRTELRAFLEDLMGEQLGWRPTQPLTAEPRVFR